MRKIKVKYVGFFNGFRPEINILCKTIMKFYDVVECDDPDYIICSVFGDKDDYYDYCKYPQVRIMYSGENYIPDFNLVDYAVSSYPLILQDRHFRYPVCFNDYFGRFKELSIKDRNYNPDILTQKVYFANFICSHESENNVRGSFFKKLNEYKRVESVGTYLNNSPVGLVVDFKNKTEFQSKCKFTICFESTNHQGFITEKISDAFLANTIPIYFGSSDVLDIFNEKAFIYCTDSNSFDSVINEIIELDNDDEKYMKMLREPIFRNREYVDSIEKEIEKFVLNIFEQPLEKAYRRSRVYAPLRHQNYILEQKRIVKDNIILINFIQKFNYIFSKKTMKKKLKRIKRVLAKFWVCQKLHDWKINK